MRKQGNSTREAPVMAYRLAMCASAAGVSGGATTMGTGAAVAGGDR